MLKENKFHFIICYNNEQYMQECTRYISFLEVPEGIETKIIGISGAESMVYNVAGNGYIGETLEKEPSGPEASGFL